jgi:hypothetical protein
LPVRTADRGANTLEADAVQTNARTVLWSRVDRHPGQPSLLLNSRFVNFLHGGSYILRERAA